MDFEVPTHDTTMGPVHAVQWFKHGDHPKVRELTAPEVRRLQSENLPAHQEFIAGNLQVGMLEPNVGLVYPGNWVYVDKDGNTHLRTDETHGATAFKLTEEEAEELSEDGQAEQAEEEEEE